MQVYLEVIYSYALKLPKNMTDWYRRKTWTAIDEEEFFAKLERARKENRAQYLMVQALELIETSESFLINIAEVLLNKILTDYPDSKTEKSPVLNSLGHIYRLRTDYSKALVFFKNSLDFEKKFPNVITSSFLDYSEIVIKSKRLADYNFVENMLLTEVKKDCIKFPIQEYKIFRFCQLYISLKVMSN